MGNTSAPVTPGAETTPRIWPATPMTAADAGIPRPLLNDLVLRYVREQGTTSLSMLRNALKLSYPVVKELFEDFRQQQFLDVRGTVGHDYVFSLTAAARHLAAERSEVCRYAGAAPVPLSQYAAVVRSQRAVVQPAREDFYRQMADLVLRDELIDELGPAIISQRSLFLYGPTGNGKTSLAERLSRLYEDTVLIPYAVEVDSHIVSVFDPLVHRRADREPDEAVDPRWVHCKRPYVSAGGELLPGMLELRLDESSGVYAAPLQMKANNGIFVIDDFGRQAMSARELLNRWIVPLDRRVDYLALRHGITFEIPFELMVVFSTNLEPSDLADDAFLRRIPNKIYVQPISVDVFDEIFERTAHERGFTAGANAAAQLRELCRAHGATELRACYPVDICNVLAWIAAYERRPVEITRESLGRAARLYFTRQRAGTGV